MAAWVLNSAKAVEMSIFVVRAFVRLRQILASNRQLAAKLDELERRIATGVACASRPCVPVAATTC